MILFTNFSPQSGDKGTLLCVSEKYSFINFKFGSSIVTLLRFLGMNFISLYTMFYQWFLVEGSGQCFEKGVLNDTCINTTIKSKIFSRLLININNIKQPPPILMFCVTNANNLFGIFTKSHEKICFQIKNGIIIQRVAFSLKTNSLV